MNTKFGQCRGSIGVMIGSVLLSAIVAISPVMAESLSPVRGVVKSSNEAVITVEFSAKVTKTPLQIGESFKKNDILIVFDCDVLNADQKAASSAHIAASSRYKSNQELQKHGAAGELEVSVSKAEMNESRARLESIRARAKNCTIRAPFDGRVADMPINRYETPSVNSPLLKIVGTDSLELRLIVPSNWLAWVKAGEVFTFSVDETGLSYQATVSGIGAEVDAVSRTVPLVASFQETPATVLPGMSGTARFAMPAKLSSR